MESLRFTAITAMSFVMVGALAAQVPQQQPPTAQPAAQARDAAEITIVGCLAQSQDAADVYILTVVPAAPASGDAAPAAAPADAATAPTDAVRASSNAKSDAARAVTANDAPSAKPATHKITGIAADQLKSHVNHHVEIKGRINAGAGQTDAAAAPEFRGSSVKMLSATCPAAK